MYTPPSPLAPSPPRPPLPLLENSFFHLTCQRVYFPAGPPGGSAGFFLPPRVDSGLGLPTWTGRPGLAARGLGSLGRNV